MEKILITPRSLTDHGHPALDRLRSAGFDLVFSTPGKQPTEQELIGLLPPCVGYLAGTEKIGEAVLRSARCLKVVSRNGVGIDNIDLNQAKKQKIRIEKALGANSRGVAELTIGLMFNASRALAYHYMLMKAGGWSRLIGFELKGKTLGVVGCGGIGKQVATLALGLGLKVTAYDLYPDYKFRPSPNFQFVSFEKLVKISDIISLHCPPSSDRRPLINDEVLSEMKKGSILINTARGDLLDETAVLDALNANRLGALAVDVYRKEPPDKSLLWLHQKVVTTPHLGGFTCESVERATETAVSNLLRVLRS